MDSSCLPLQKRFTENQSVHGLFLLANFLVIIYELETVLELWFCLHIVYGGANSQSEQNKCWKSERILNLDVYHLDLHSHLE